MENTGIFKHLNYEMTSIVIVDSDSSSLQFKKDEQALVQHLESISDHFMEFTNENSQLIRGYYPVIDIKPEMSVTD